VPHLNEPGRTVQLVKAALRQARAEGRDHVTRDDAEIAVSVRAGVPRAFLSRARARAKLEELERELTANLPGNEVAREHVLAAARATLFNLHDADRPRATGLLLGPPGAGKTSLITEYARILELPFTRILMSAFGRDFDVDMFLKTVGEFAHAHPHGVIFLDEFDEASPKVQNALLAALESVYVHQLGAGGLEPAYIGNVQIFAASNAAEDLVTQSARQGRRVSEEALVSAAGGVISKKFMDRLDFVAPMYPADQTAYRAIVQRQVDRALDHFKIKPDQIANYGDMIARLASLRPQSDSSNREAGRTVARAIREPVGELLRGERVSDERGLSSARFRFGERLELDCEPALTGEPNVIAWRPRRS
jgi:ATP-dependent Clp protease ATP-binding subunit ClpA